MRAPLTIAISVGEFIDSLYESFGVVEQTFQFSSGVGSRANAVSKGVLSEGIVSFLREDVYQGMSLLVPKALKINWALVLVVHLGSMPMSQIDIHRVAPGLSVGANFAWIFHLRAQHL